MATSLDPLLANNARWASQCTDRDPQFFSRLQNQQSPRYLWIGCSDSRVPANQIVGLAPGEMFVHRNIANVVAHTDLNCLSVLQYAVDTLAVEHVIVTGHYGCGGVRAVAEGARLGLIDNWLRYVDDVRRRYQDALAPLSPAVALDRLAELNVIEQARHVCETTIVRDAWRRGQSLCVHGWIYGLSNGLLHDLGFAATASDQVPAAHRAALAALLPPR